MKETSPTESQSSRVFFWRVSSSPTSCKIPRLLEKNDESSLHGRIDHSRFIFKPRSLWMLQIFLKRKYFLQLNRHWWPVTAMWKAAKTLWSKRTFFSKPGRFPQSSPHKPLKAVHAQQLRKKVDFINNGKQIMGLLSKIQQKKNFWENRTSIKSRKWMILSFHGPSRRESHGTPQLKCRRMKLTNTLSD